MARTKFRFSIFDLFNRLHVYIGLWGDDGVWRHTSAFFKGHICSKGVKIGTCSDHVKIGTCSDHGQHQINSLPSVDANWRYEKIKTFPIYAPPYCTELPFVNQILIIPLLSIFVRYDHDSGICGRSSLFCISQRGVHHFFSFDKGGGVMCFCEVFCW